MKIIDYIKYKALKAAKDPTTNPETLDYLVMKGDSRIRYYAIHNPSVSKQTIDKLNNIYETGKSLMPDEYFMPSLGEGG